MEEKEQERVFYCPACRIEFSIKVEPSYEEDVVKQQYPESLHWLAEVKDCPGCGDILEER